MQRTHWTTILLWLARIYSIAGIAILLLFFLGEGLFAEDPSPLSFTAAEGFLFALFPVGVGIGLLIGTWMPRFGGWLATLALIGFYLFFFVDRGELPGGPWFVIFAGGGPALVAADWLKRRCGD